MAANNAGLSIADARQALRGCHEAAGLSWPPTKLAVAVSGGADSLALALLTREVAHEDNILLHAYIVDHRLRPESGAEALQVQACLSALGVLHRLLAWDHGPISGNLAAAARDARYRLLSAACQADGVDVLLLGHHADDQAETLLHQLLRGSGVDGLSAMPTVRKDRGIYLMRPLLGIPKTMLEATCRRFRQPWIEDPSNEDPRFARTLLRRLLSEFPGQGASAARLAETAAHMARARAALEWMTDALLATTQHQSEGETVLSLSAWRAAPEEIRLRALRRLATQLGASEPPRLEALIRLAAGLMAREEGTHTLHRLCWQWQAGQLHVRPEFGA